MLEIPLQAWVNQELLVILDDQDCTIAVYQRGQATYLDLSVSGQAVCRGAICQPGMGIIQKANADFRGQLYFIDERSRPEEQHAPEWQGVGTRWKLYWLSNDEVDELSARDFAAALAGGNDG